VLQLSHSGTVILGDNLLRHGDVLPTTAAPDESALGVMAFNERIASHPRLESILLPILKGKVDGMSISRVK
jgi:predicted O-methyltransferase YrrM